MKYSLAVFKRALKLYKDKPKDDFYKDMKHLVECQEKELRERLKNIPDGERHLRFTAGVIHQIEEILGE